MRASIPRHRRSRLAAKGSMVKHFEQLTPVGDLQIGMYVSSLDRPWLETPFLIQGFAIANQQDIDELAKHCRHVYIDIEKAHTPRNQSTLISLKNFSRPDRKKIQELIPHRKLRQYTDQTNIDEELALADQVMLGFTDTIMTLFKQFEKNTPININVVRQSIEPMVESIIRNPDACIWLTRLKNADDYTYHHAVSSSVWAVALGRHIGLPKIDLQTLAIGVSLFDIGKMRLPKELLDRRGKLTEEEFKLVQSHVQLGIDCLKEMKGINNGIMDIVAHHHERHDASGYPNQLRGDAIPVFARIASIADCYDAITTRRPYAEPISPGQAVRKLFEWRNKGFQAELVEEFIQAIGIYPAGTLVELSNGDVGVVLCGYRSRRLRPKIIQLLDRNKQPLPTVKVVDLMTTSNDETGQPLEIIDSLEPGAYGLQLHSLNL
jgi:HD-GYP domain-containing protein (c-di-GMP phosphodiesterase class II)